MNANTTALALLACGLAFGVAAIFGPEVAAVHGSSVHRAWVAATVAVEVVTLLLAWTARRAFDPGDPGRTTWTLIAGFLGIRLLAELRLLSFYFEFVPAFVMADPALLDLYTVWLRYLYTLGDLLMVAALLHTLRTYRALGLQFGLRRVDWGLIALLAAMPLVVFGLRDRMGSFLSGDDPSLVHYRLVAVTVGAVVAAMSLAVLRFAVQMGGGALASIWGAIGFAGFARAGSFVALASLTGVSTQAADLAEQALLWVFASCWLLAALRQRALTSAG